jgi:hypothetical protein
MVFNKNQLFILKKTKRFVKKYMNNLDDVSHDYKNIKLVVKFSSKIAKKEGIKNSRDLFQIKAHDILLFLGDFRERKYLRSASFDFAQLTISQLVERSRNQRRRYIDSGKSPKYYYLG